MKTFGFALYLGVAAITFATARTAADALPQDKRPSDVVMAGRSLLWPVWVALGLVTTTGVDLALHADSAKVSPSSETKGA